MAKLWESHFSKTHFFVENRLFHPLEGYRHPQTRWMPLDNFILIKNQPLYTCFRPFLKNGRAYFFRDRGKNEQKFSITEIGAWTKKCSSVVNTNISPGCPWYVLKMDIMNLSSKLEWNWTRFDFRRGVEWSLGMGFSHVGLFWDTLYNLTDPLLNWAIDKVKPNISRTSDKNLGHVG